MSNKNTLVVTQKKSPIGRQSDQKQTLIGLGLNKIGRSKVLNDTHTKMDAEVKQAQENAEPDSYTMKRVGKRRVRVPVVSQKRKNEIKEEIESKYYNRLRGVTTSPNIDSSPKKVTVSTLDEAPPNIVDATTNVSGGSVGASGSGNLASSIPNISASNSDNNFTLYSQTQYNILV